MRAIVQRLSASQSNPCNQRKYNGCRSSDSRKRNCVGLDPVQGDPTQQSGFPRQTNPADLPCCDGEPE